jgi:hypothetical protein
LFGGSVRLKFGSEALRFFVVLATELPHRGNGYLDAAFNEEFGDLFVAGVFRSKKKDRILVIL